MRTPALRADGLDLLSPADLGLPPAELAQMRGIYGIAEFTTALKPHLLRFLLDEGADVVLFLDSDIDVHAGLHDVVSAGGASRGRALGHTSLSHRHSTGRARASPRSRGAGSSTRASSPSAESGRPFLDWWASRLRRDCLFCEPMGVHADQRWLDLVPSYFDHHVLRDPGVNVAQWNLHERRLRREDGSFTVNGAPLRTFHFSGFDPEKLGAPPSGWMADAPALRRSPSNRTRAALPRLRATGFSRPGYRESRRIPYRYATTAAGTPLGTWQRRAYRELLLAAEARGAGHPRPVRPAADPPSSSACWPTPARPVSSPSAALARLTDARLARPVAGAIAGSRCAAALALSRQVRPPCFRGGVTPGCPTPSPAIARGSSTRPTGTRARRPVAADPA